MAKAKVKAPQPQPTPRAPRAPRVRSPRHGKRGPEKGLTKRADATLTKEFFGAVPEPVWRKILSAQPISTPGGKLLALFDDIGFKGAGLERMCAEANIDIRDLVKLFVDYKIGESLVKAADHAEAIVLGTMEDAKSATYLCKLCVGVVCEEHHRTCVQVNHPMQDKVTIHIECPDCGGVGRTRRAGDARARDTALKLLGGLEQENTGQSQVNLQINFGAQHSQAVTRGQQLLADGRRRRGQTVPQATSPPPGTVDAEVVGGSDGQ